VDRANLQDEDEARADSKNRTDLEGGIRVTPSTEATFFTKSGGSLVVLQVNCRSIYNKLLEFWNLIDTYNPDIIIGTES
jgi:hypothetical protein